MENCEVCKDPNSVARKSWLFNKWLCVPCYIKAFAIMFSTAAAVTAAIYFFF